MRRISFAAAIALVMLCGSAAVTIPTSAQAPATRRLAATEGEELRAWDVAVSQLARDGELSLRQRHDDPMIAGRSHERFDQYFNGVPVFGGQVVRQADNTMTVSLFGTIYQGIALDTTPAFSADEAKAMVERQAGAELGQNRMPELMVLPRGEDSYSLAFRARILSEEGLMVYFIDARTGEVLLKYNDLKTQSAVGRGTGVLGDTKKVSVISSGALFRTVDELRPPSIETYDLRGNTNRAMNFINGVVALGLADLANDSDNVWTDGAAVDAHAYAGWTYDYYYRRFGRRGLDNHDLPVVSLVNPVNRNDVFRQPAFIVGLFYMNAAYFGNGVMVYGVGLPAGVTDTLGRSWNFMSGAIDVVAHELTHGVIDYSSQLVYLNESGALNEAFADIMSAGAEFFFFPAGSGPLQADYEVGEDVVTPGGIRSMSNPLAHGDPDHYSIRYVGPDDNGGVHINSGIANQAFYLAIEGGVNRTSGQGVAGVGSGNREQIEKVFYRAFIEMMPSSATFSTARAATIQAARDLYGAGSDAERAVTQAWTAVGVH